MRQLTKAHTARTLVSSPRIGNSFHKRNGSWNRTRQTWDATNRSLSTTERHCYNRVTETEKRPQIRSLLHEFYRWKCKTQKIYSIESTATWWCCSWMKFWFHNNFSKKTRNKALAELTPGVGAPFPGFWWNTTTDWAWIETPTCVSLCVVYVKDSEPFGGMLGIYGSLLLLQRRLVAWGLRAGEPHAVPVSWSNVWVSSLILGSLLRRDVNAASTHAHVCVCFK